MAMEQAAKNTLSAEWQGPYGGIPNFGTAKLASLIPVLEAHMVQNLAKIDAIADNTGTYALRAIAIQPN